MLLESIQLSNYRAFYGDNVLRFASASDKNVTLVIHSNGAGGSTLLGAFYWCLFGKNADKIVRSEFLDHATVNFSSASQGVTVASVGITIRSNSAYHRLLREASVGRPNGSLSIADAPDNFRAVLHRVLVLHRISSIHEFEAHLFKETNLRAFVEKMLDVSVTEREFEHVSRKLKLDLDFLFRDKEVKPLIGDWLADGKMDFSDMAEVALFQLAMISACLNLWEGFPDSHQIEHGNNLAVPIFLSHPSSFMTLRTSKLAAEFIRRMPAQVVLFLGTSEAELIEVLQPKVGAMYALVRHVETDFHRVPALNIAGSKVPIHVGNSTFEGTRIVRLNANGTRAQ